MAERYTKLLVLDKPKWSIDSPVILEKGALLQDNVTQVTLLQFQFRNMGCDPIQAMRISVHALDAITQSVAEKVKFDYLDLTVRSDETFGSDVPIVLQKKTTRHFLVILEKIIFADGSIREVQSELKDIEAPKSLDVLGKLESQFVREARSLNPAIRQCTTLPEKYEDYRYCACGAWNVGTEKACRRCSSDLEGLLDLVDVEYLGNQQGIREKQESRKVKKHILIVGVALIAVIGIFLMIQPHIYILSDEEREIFHSAEVAYNKQEYLLSASLYAQLPEYKKAQKKLKSIDFPLYGAWSWDRPLWGIYDQSFFDQEGVLSSVAYSKQSRDKESFLADPECRKYSWVNYSISEDGIYYLTYKDEKGTITGMIDVQSNNHFRWFYQLSKYNPNDPGTYDVYYRLS